MTAPTRNATTTGSHEALPVRLEPCPAFRPDRDAAWPACDVCGWLEHDHAGPGPSDDAVVSELPRRVATMPRRLAS
jgi:hypothetical protein